MSDIIMAAFISCTSAFALSLFVAIHSLSVYWVLHTLWHGTRCDSEL